MSRQSKLANNKSPVRTLELKLMFLIMLNLHLCQQHHLGDHLEAELRVCVYFDTEKNHAMMQKNLLTAPLRLGMNVSWLYKKSESDG